MSNKEKKKENIYEKLGIDPSKKSVREIFEKINENEYPGAFVNMITDPYCNDRVITQHQDGDGSKFVQRLIHYLESGNEEVFRGMVDDALSMNTGDIAASGFVFGPWIITDVLNVNFPRELKKIIMGQVALRLAELREIYCEHGFNFKILGGETADLPDQVRSGVFDIAITAWAEKSDLIKGNVQVGDVIFGFPSDGKAAWEESDNSGMMSNGLTAARSGLMSRSYNKKYPKLKRERVFYKGRFNYDEYLPSLGMAVGEALISPTRQWAIVIREIIIALKSFNALHLLHGISMNTGGGATKILNVGTGGILYTKTMPYPSPLFQLIQKETKETWENMYKNFNGGIGIDVVGADDPIFQKALEKAAKKCALPLHKLGLCRPSSSDRGNEVCLSTPFGNFFY